ncbi:hypothetical protein EJO68_05210 [Variovorax atrisoli]|uniref:pentapeptide repeat-containing protein n=1 Tax=Variovorax atrisoli TaxID=3394203 RepID=UPI000F7E4A51|nr:pentapeptide repeat-containing protein [Variovorax sp. 369]RTD98771.1 hypothetical protein EJO68_05210 [Variovorax sp. 369]
MSSQIIILAHDMWRKGAGGAPAGLVGQADSFAYAGLDLGLAQFAATTFAGTSFAATSFNQAGWSGCQFTGCSFTQCDFGSISITGCTFINCSFTRANFDGAIIASSTFRQCQWDDISFAGGSWSDVGVLDCSGTVVHAQGLQGRSVDFTGSTFEQLEFQGANIN